MELCIYIYVIELCDGSRHNNERLSSHVSNFLRLLSHNYLSISILLGNRNSFDMTTSRATTQGLLFDCHSIMFFDRLQYSIRKQPTYSFLTSTVIPWCAVIPSYRDYFHIRLLYCKGQSTHEHLIHTPTSFSSYEWLECKADNSVN